MGSTFVIVGGGAAAGKAAQTLRDEGFDGRVMVITEEALPPYERPPLSKGVLLGNDDPGVPIMNDRAWYAEHDVELRLSTRVRSVDLTGRSVELAGAGAGSGAGPDGEVVPFDRLLLATGSSVRRLRVPGADLDGVAYLRTLPQSLALLEAFRGGARVAVVGAGWIGLEVASAARQHGCDVVVVEPESVPLAGPLGPEMGQVFADLHRDHGVEFRFGRQAERLRGGADGRVGAVVTDDDAEIEADLVVVGIGVTPNVELAEQAGLEVDRGVLADAALRTSDPDVFVAGDIAQWQHPVLGTRIRVEHWSNAMDGGAAAARSMMGREVSYDVLPFFFTDQYDLGMEYSGHLGPDGYDRVVVRGDLDSREFLAFWLRNGRVLAGMNVNVWDVQDDIRGVILAGGAVDSDRLADPGVPLREVRH